MYLRLTLTIVLLLIAPIICSRTAYADAVTTNYVEAGLINREIMRWDFTCNVLVVCNGAPAGQVAWNSSVSSVLLPGGPNGISALVFNSTHVLGPHLVDVNPGQPFSITVLFGELALIPAGPNFVRFAGGPFTVVHTAIGSDHSDIYDLLARRNAAGGFDFVFGDLHVPQPAPEPATLLLLGSGLAGVAIRMRRRLKRRTKAQG